MIYVATDLETWEPLIGLDNSASWQLIPQQPHGSNRALSSQTENIQIAGPTSSIKPQPLNCQSLIKNSLKNGDHIFFEIDAIDLWLNIQIDLSFGDR